MTKDCSYRKLTNSTLANVNQYKFANLLFVICCRIVRRIRSDLAIVQKKHQCAIHGRSDGEAVLLPSVYLREEL